MIEHRTLRTMFAGISGGLAASSLSAVTSPVRPDVLRLDLRRMSELRQYKIAVHAIRTGYDHAYVALAAEDDSQAMSYEAFYGFYPNSSASGPKPVEMYRFLVKGVRGQITTEDRATLGLPAVHEVIADLDSTRFRSAVAMLDRWKGQTEYQLAFNDCITFAADMARTVGMSVPLRLFRDPVEYLEALMASNRP